LGYQTNVFPNISTYQATGVLSELNSFNTSAYFTSDSVELEPGDTHFEMFAADGFQAVKCRIGLLLQLGLCPASTDPNLRPA
jgi:hypothetical protein